MFTDLSLKGSSYENNLKLAIEASNLDWNNVNFTYSPNTINNALEFKNSLTEELEGLIEIDYALEIKSNNVDEIRKTVSKFRKKVNCISVVGGDLKINRAVCENIRVDILSRPYLGRYDSGLNHVLAKEALDNSVAIELSFKDILDSYLSYRSKILSNFKDIYSLFRKFNFPLILSSKAESIFDLRKVHDFKTFFIATGLKEDEVEKSFKVASGILDFNKNRQDYILKDVRLVK